VKLIQVLTRVVDDDNEEDEATCCRGFVGSNGRAAFSW
jgi:hypothetical protein